MAMETAENQAQCDSKAATKIVNPSSSSFRLRSPSLNSVRLRRIFDMFDRNNDGIITVDELSQPLSRLGLDADLADLDSTIQSFVNSKSAAGLTFDDFQVLHRSLDAELFGGCGEAAATEAQEEAEMREAFKVFDEDNDGFISARELEAVLAKLGLIEKGGDEIGRVEQMISSVDRNRDGVVDLFEFKEMMSCVMVRHC